MTKKDREQTPREEVTPILDQANQEEEQEQAAEPVEEAMDGENLLEVEQEAEEEEPASDFLERWKQRHQAHLAQQEQETQEEESTDSSVSTGLSVFKKKKRQPKQLEEGSTSIEKPVRPAIPSLALWKAFPIFVLGLVVSLLAIYFLSPLGKRKDMVVQGNRALTSQEILAKSLVQTEDYTLTTFLQKDTHAAHIVTSSEWVQSADITYHFPFEFVIQVREYVGLGYIKDGQTYHPILSSGSVSTSSLKEEELPESPLLVELKDQDLIKKLFLQLAEIDQEIVEGIQLITLTPTKATADLLTLTMEDGHKVLIPLSEVKRKLPYYGSISKQLAVPSFVDMEVGIFSYMQ